jgi:predicted kinase
MEGIFQNPQYIQRAVNLAKQKNISTVVYQLTCPLKNLQERDKTREEVKEGCRKSLGSRVIKQLYQILEKNPLKEAIEINTEKITLNKCINLISKKLV